MSEIVGPTIIAIVVALSAGWCLYDFTQRWQQRKRSEGRLKGLRPPRRPYDGWGRW